MIAILKKAEKAVVLIPSLIRRQVDGLQRNVNDGTVIPIEFLVAPYHPLDLPYVSLSVSLESYHKIGVVGVPLLTGREQFIRPREYFYQLRQPLFRIARACAHLLIVAIHAKITIVKTHCNHLTSRGQNLSPSVDEEAIGIDFREFNLGGMEVFQRCIHD